MSRSYLCVGGPKAGQRIAVRDGCSFFRIPIRHGSSLSADAAIVTYTEYREQYFPLDATGNNITVWAPAEQSHLETMTMLLAAYERK
jgi:hypothetical protein